MKIQPNKDGKDFKNEKKGISLEKCNHVFIRDLIDVTPDLSKEIIYCEKCEFVPK